MLHKCPVCYSEIIQCNKDKEVYGCNNCSSFSFKQVSGEYNYKVGDRVFVAEEKKDMRFFILLKQSEYKDLVKRIENLETTFNQQDERYKKKTVCNDSALEKWKQIEEERINVLKGSSD